ncbi:uncharacterized protein K452DRAFT_281229 [Aplosporella prunicola CBS 121167]|uniref:FAD-binding PCMH-type domain-containing protein n=1 Tax=Aplosporella prunicola CBS 121167 TaxID=1176127 RepID=A0A6A6AXD9_9PEZI|nr:uncharacterized protein K452DRAFT_281229 [Aplosporella prunicola CBS 121167]KAF2135645.1 hypothetical protein K452DRAFT_281229 [Aplosporella prunicola CBS 121167]
MYCLEIHKRAVPFFQLLILAVLAFSLPTAAAPPLFSFEKTQLHDTDIQTLPTIHRSLFAFDNNSSSQVPHNEGRCKVYPTDQSWPSPDAWAALNTLTSDALIKVTAPQAAPCYPGAEYNAEICADLTANWTNSFIHLSDPVEMLSPVTQGLTCQPPDVFDSKNCRLGGYPLYVVNATTTRQIQAAVNFARNTGVRLVVKNTGHDFSGKSGGKEALSIWTHHLKDIMFLEEYDDGTYKGPAIKAGSGVQGYEMYQAASERNVVVVGGEGKTVGMMGGYILGSGHSPLSSLYGTGADQILALEVVTPDGRFVTASPTSHSDLFWALSGGGGSTFGVVTSATVKAHPEMHVTGVRFIFTSDPDAGGTDRFFAGLRKYLDYFESHADKGIYSYWLIQPSTPAPGRFTFTMMPWLAPNMTRDQAMPLLSPWIADLEALDIKPELNITYHETFYESWLANFPLEVVEKTNVTTASRIFPRANFASASQLNATFAELRTSIEKKNHVVVGFNMSPTPRSGIPDNAVNPAWRDCLMFAQQSVRWSPNATAAEILTAHEDLTLNDMQRWRDITPGGGTYLAESDRREPNFQQAFYGAKYDRLLEVKRKYDPKEVFWAVTAVGSEGWTVETEDGLPTENGRLCRVV